MTELAPSQGNAKGSVLAPVAVGQLSDIESILGEAKRLYQTPPEEESLYCQIRRRKAFFSNKDNVAQGCHSHRWFQSRENQMCG